MISLLGVLLIGAILARSFKEHMFGKYPAFYSYLAYVLVQSVIRFSVNAVRPSLYPNVYWYTEFLGILVGCGVIWEIYSQALAGYAGVVRVARALIIAAILIALAWVLIDRSAQSSLLFPLDTAADLDRTLRGVQAIFLVLVVTLLLYYAIPLGRNLKGMIVGYGVYVGITIITLAVRSFLGMELQVQPLAYSLALMVWCTTLWSYAPNPKAERDPRLEGDYEAVSAMALGKITQVRRYLSRVARP